MPDVAGDASQASGYLIVLNGATTQIGGTSAVAPLWAGLTALINQAAGKSLGFFLPTLYQNPHIVRAITSATGRSTPTWATRQDPAGAAAPVSACPSAARCWPVHRACGHRPGRRHHRQPASLRVRAEQLRPSAGELVGRRGLALVRPGHATGGSVVGPVGVTTVNQRPYAFVQSNTGHLWVNWWDGSAWHWSDQGPAGGTAAAQA